MSESLRKIYEQHHAASRQAGFSVMKSDRAGFFSKAIGKGKRVLDLGCRDGSLTSAFVEGNKVVGVDIDEVSLKRAADNLGIETMSFDIQANWHYLAGRKFDAVVAGEFLEHVYFPGRIIQKVSDVLADGGMFVGSVPNAFSLKNRLRYLFAVKKNTPLSDPTHINQFSANELRQMLLRSFKTAKIFGIGRLGPLARSFPQWFAFDLLFLAKK